jgi:hypothetical protein
MTTRINYQSNWMAVSEAVKCFDSPAIFLDAARNGDLRTRGIFFDDVSAHESNPVSDLQKETWQTYKFDVQTGLIEGEDVINRVDFGYKNIEVFKPDMIQVYIAANPKFASNGKTEPSIVIIKILKDLIPQNAGKFPTAGAVLSAIEERKHEFPSIMRIERAKKGGRIYWNTLACTDDPSTGFETLENKLLPYRAELKELLKVLYPLP